MIKTRYDIVPGTIIINEMPHFKEYSYVKEVHRDFVYTSHNTVMHIDFYLNKSQFRAVYPKESEYLEIYNKVIKFNR